MCRLKRWNATPPNLVLDLLQEVDIAICSTSDRKIAIRVRAAGPTLQEGFLCWAHPWVRCIVPFRWQKCAVKVLYVRLRWNDHVEAQFSVPSQSNSPRKTTPGIPNDLRRINLRTTFDIGTKVHMTASPSSRLPGGGIEIRMLVWDLIGDRNRIIRNQSGNVDVQRSQVEGPWSHNKQTGELAYNRLW